VVSCRLSMGQGLGLCFSCRWSVVSCQWDKGWSFVSVVGGQLSVVSGTRAGALFQLFIRVFPFPSFDFRFPRSEPLSISRSPEALSLTTDRNWREI